MKFSLTLIGGLLFAAPLVAGATAPHATPSAISAVTVFGDRAQITRTATVALRPGRQQVAFADLPVGLQEDSVRVSGTGAAGARVIDVSIQRNYLEKPFGDTLRRLAAEKTAAEDALRAVTGRLAALASQKAFYESVRVGYGERISKEILTARPGTAEVGEFVRFVGDGLLTVDGKQREAEREQRDLAAKIDALNREINEIQNGGARESRSVLVELEAAKAGETALELAYLVPGASWEPVYDLRLADSGTETELVFRALVRQSTGEEWREVPLTLSTARPAAGGAPPELVPWHIGFFRPQPVYGATVPAPRKAMLKKEAMAMDMAMAEMAAPAAAPVVPVTAVVEEGRAATQFRLPRTVTVPADGAPQGVTVAMATLPTTVTYQVVPKRSSLAFVKSPVRNTLGYPLLPGRVNIFNGNTFSGASYLKGMAPGETIDLFFGSDDGIKVVRHELKQHRDAGFISGNRQTYGYRIEVTNHKREAQNVTILDQLPLADDEAIVVTLADASSKPETTATTGELKWHLALAPNEKKEITFTIQVEYPKDREVRGL
jgi:uncharacterized protein (TIGR02231 family)